MCNCLVVCFLHVILFLSGGCKKADRHPVAKVTTYATGLSSPMGIEVDKQEMYGYQKWGTGNNDGKVLIIDKSGTKYHPALRGY